jgi:hypothetical protein
MNSYWEDRITLNHIYLWMFHEPLFYMNTIFEDIYERTIRTQQHRACNFNNQQNLVSHAWTIDKKKKNE